MRERARLSVMDEAAGSVLRTSRLPKVLQTVLVDSALVSFRRAADGTLPGHREQLYFGYEDFGTSNLRGYFSGSLQILPGCYNPAFLAGRSPRSSRLGEPHRIK